MVKRNSMRFRPTVAVVAVVAVAAVGLMTSLAACGSDATTSSTDTVGGVIVPISDAESAATAIADDASTASPATAAPAAAVPTPSAAADAAPAAEAAPGNCLIGDWSVAPADVASYLERSAEIYFEDVVASGQISISFTASTYTWTQTSQVDFSIAYDTGPTPATVTQNETLTGSWTATTSTLTSSNFVQNGGFTITENGVAPADTGDLFQGVYAYDPVNALSYSCDGPTIDLPIGQTQTESFPVTLVPA